MLRTHHSIPALLLLAACGSQPAESAPDVASDAPDTAGVDTADVVPDAETDPDAVPDTPPDVADDVPLDVADDVPPDAGADTPTDVVADTPTDVAEDRCAPPIRISPLSGPAVGGTRVEIYGGAWYIGALWWVAGFDVPREECTLYFETPPHAAGQVPVSVAYGGREIEGDSPFGTFTYE
jgi:hypothetical protein